MAAHALVGLAAGLGCWLDTAPRPRRAPDPSLCVIAPEERQSEELEALEVLERPAVEPPLELDPMPPLPPDEPPLEQQELEVEPLPDDEPPAEVWTPALQHVAKRLRPLPAAPLPEPPPLAVLRPTAPSQPLAVTPTPRATPGRRRATAAPDMPAALAPAGLAPGTRVDLILTVEPEGRISQVVVERSSGVPAFDDAARGWVLSRWRFEPGGDRYRTRVPVLRPR